MIIISATGSGKKRTLPALKESSIAEVVAVHGRDIDKIYEICLEYDNVEAYTDIVKMLSEVEYDLIYIASPPFLHREDIAIASKFNKPIICEKPMASNFDDAVYIQNKIKEHSVEFMLAHHMRHQPAITHIKSILDEGNLGSTRTAFMQWNFPIDVDSDNAKWKLDSELGGQTAFYDAGIHVIDVALYFWGKPVSLYARGNNHLLTDTTDSVNVVLQYKEFNVVINTSQSQTTIGNDLHIYCEKGVVSALQCFGEQSIESVVVRTKNSETSESFQSQDLYKNEVEAFCSYLNKDTEYVGTTLDESMDAMSILQAIDESVRVGKVVKLM